MQVFDWPERDFRALSLAFSPDGRLLAGRNDGRVLVLDAVSGAGRAKVGVIEATTGGTPGVGFTADGRAVVTRRSQPIPSVWVYPLNADATARECPKDHGFALDVGRTGEFAYLTHDSAGQFQIVRWNPLTGKTKPGPSGTGYLRLLAVSADEKWIAGSDGKNVRIWDFSGPKPPTRAARQFKPANAAGVAALALSSDGVFVAFRGGPGAWFGDRRDGKVWVLAESRAHNGRDLAFHPARPVLAFAGSEEVVFYDVAVRTELKRFAWGIGKVTALAFSADGLRCAAASAGEVVVWDVDV